MATIKRVTVFESVETTKVVTEKMPVSRINMQLNDDEALLIDFLLSNVATPDQRMYDMTNALIKDLRAAGIPYRKPYTVTLAGQTYRVPGGRGMDVVLGKQED